MKLFFCFIISCIYWICSNGFVPLFSRNNSVLSTRNDANIRHAIIRTNAVSPKTNDEFIIRTAIAGAGPSGLLLAHFLLSENLRQSAIQYKVTLLESRSDPRLLSTNALDERAYALGLGVRGRTAIQSVLGVSLWDQVKKRGFQSDKFQMYFNPTTKITLRDDKSLNKLKEEGEKVQEPSLLIYQTDLCSALLDELENRSRAGVEGGLNIRFNAKILTVDLHNQSVTIQDDSESPTMLGPFDLICGCDGINSKVRDAMVQASQGIMRVDKKGLPGIYKVARMGHMPPTLEPSAVALIMPSSTPQMAKPGTTLFVEPVINGGACVLFAGRDGTDPLLGLKRQDVDVKEIVTLTEDIMQRFPLLNTTSTKVDIPSVVTQLLSQNPSSASSIWCNTYSFLDRAVLCGDAAHCTGGVSGQGVNSALLDSMVLAQCLHQHVSTFPEDGTKKSAIRQALMDYSMRQVPEGHALYEMSVGALPATETVPSDTSKLDEIILSLKRIFRVVNTGLDTIFGGRFGIGQQPIQTRFTTSMESFSSIRRNRELYFDKPFTSDEDYVHELKDLMDRIDKKFNIA